MTRPKPTTPPAGLDHPLAALQLSSRARKACDKAALRTVRDFVAAPRADVLAIPGCGARTYEELEHKVAAHLARTLGDDEADLDLQRPLRPLVAHLPFAAAIERLDLDTVGEFMALPRELGVKALGRAAWQRVWAEIEQSRRLPAAATPLLPDSLKQLPLSRAALPGDVLQQLEEHGCRTIGHAVSLPAALFEDGQEPGPAAAQAFRTALDRLFRTALEHLDAVEPRHALDWPTLRARLLAALEEDEREWFVARIDLDRRARRRRPAPGFDPQDMAAKDAAVRRRLAERSPTLLSRLRQEVLRELDTFEGIVRTDRLAAGSLLHTAAKGSGDSELPLRLAAFCWPDELHIQAGCLTTVSPTAWSNLMHELRTLTRPRLLPRPLDEISAQLYVSGEPVPRGLLLHLLTEACHLRVQIDPDRGEVVQPQQKEPAARLTQLLVEEGGPTRLDDLVFHYRERFRVAQPERLRSHLRRDAAFLEIGPDVWSLRAWHEDELDAATALADHVVRTVCERGGKQAVGQLVPDADERTRYLVLDLVRRDGHVRYLGRGEVCAATHQRSAVLDQLLRDFRRAMGEVPLSRFVANQPPERRRLVERLLRENRLFVFPSPDRIDVLTNYPYNEERLHQLITLVDAFLQTHSGYAPLELVLEEVNRCELGGGWLHPVLLGELLRRHGPFEVLPGQLVARRSLGLGGWLMRRARNALRQAAVPISVAELLVERPELAEFRSCLEQLLQRDPLVQTPDGTRFQIA